MDKFYHITLSHEDLSAVLVALERYNITLKTQEAHSELQDVLDKFYSAPCVDDSIIDRPYLDRKFDEVKKLLGA